MVVWWCKVYIDECIKIFQSSSLNFWRVAKDVGSGVVVIKDDAFSIDQFWSFFRLLGVVFLGVDSRINRLIGQQLVVNDSFPIHSLSLFLASILTLPSFAKLHLASTTIFFVHYYRTWFIFHRPSNESFKKWFDFVPFLAMIRRWKFDLLNFSLLNHVALKHRVFFYPAFSKWFKTVL